MYPPAVSHSLILSLSVSFTLSGHLLAILPLLAAIRTPASFKVNIRVYFSTLAHAVCFINYGTDKM